MTGRFYEAARQVLIHLNGLGRIFRSAIRVLITMPL